MPERQWLPDGELPTVSAGLPASLLAQRPDLKAAEQRLRKLLANIDNTQASYYPTFTLTGTLGTSSISLLNFLQNPYAALGASLALPFIQWNTMKLNVEISKTEYEEAVVNFSQTLYSALSDLRPISQAIAVAVVRELCIQGLGEVPSGSDNDAGIEEAVAAVMWAPDYTSYC